MTKDSDRTSSQADFLANLSVSQEKENLRKMTEISGRKLLGLSKSPDQLGLLEKMLVESLNSISTPFYRTWRVQTTPQGALIFQLRASVLPTKEKESGLLPTPTQDSASERTKKYKQGGTPLPMAVKMLPTPTVGCEEGGEQSNRVERTKSGGFILRKKNKPEKTYGAKLSDAMLYLEKQKMYPTPTTQDAKNNANPSQMKRKIKPLNAVIGGRLNPNFVEYLMGFQQDWTRIDQTGSKDSETQSCRKSHSTSDLP